MLCLKTYFYRITNCEPSVQLFVYVPFANALHFNVVWMHSLSICVLSCFLLSDWVFFELLFETCFKNKIITTVSLRVVFKAVS